MHTVEFNKNISTQSNYFWFSSQDTDTNLYFLPPESTSSLPPKISFTSDLS